MCSNNDVTYTDICLINGALLSTPFEYFNMGVKEKHVVCVVLVGLTQGHA